jgi:hypothetical protein
MAHFVVKRHAAACLDLTVADDRTLRQQRPDAMRIENTGDAALIVVAAKNPLVTGTVRWFVRSNQRHTLAGS